MRLDINLATQPYQDSKRFYTSWIPLLIVLLAAAIASSTYAYRHFVDSRSTQRQLDDKQQQMAQLDKELADAKATLALPQNSGTRDQSEFLNELFARKAFSWTRVLADLETVMPNGVQVVSIKPDISADHQLRFTLTVAADKREDAIELVRHMENSQRFVEPRITTERTQRDSKDNRIKVDIVYIPRLPQVISPAAPKVAQHG
jgi:type IV pilus assembly protein PilN